MQTNTVIEQMRVLPNIDVNDEVERRVNFIKCQLINSGSKTLVLGISGGIDSCTLGRLAQLAVNELNQQQEIGYQFVAVRLPYDVQADEIDAEASINFIQPSQTLIVNVQPGADAIDLQTRTAMKNIGLLPDSVSKCDFV
jgi:NAD+ synthase